MESWYAASVVMYLRFIEGPQDQYVVWENVHLVRADCTDAARLRALELGGAAEGDASGTLEWDGRRAEWMCAGVRKILTLEPFGEPQDGTGVTYSQYLVTSQEDLQRLVSGESVVVVYDE